MVNALDLGSSGPGSNPGCLSSPRCNNGYREFNVGNNPALNKHPIQEGVEMFLVTSCYRNRDKLQQT